MINVFRVILIITTISFSKLTPRIVTIMCLDRHQARTLIVILSFLIVYISYATIYGIIIRHDLVTSSIIASNVAVVLRIFYLYWRRTRRPKPSRVFGRVRAIGHRLVVVPVPADSPKD